MNGAFWRNEHNQHEQMFKGTSTSSMAKNMNKNKGMYTHLQHHQ
jgi:hypothetical protein